MKLKKFLLRYFPSGIILQYERDGVMKQKPVDLLDLAPGVDVEVCADPCRLPTVPWSVLPLSTWFYT